MRIAVVGAGGVGGYFGGRLAQAGHEVVFVARGAHLEALLKRGLLVQSVAGSFTLPVQAVEQPAEAGPVDVVLLAVKAWQVREAAEAGRALVGEGTFVVPLQNGVEAADEAASVLGPDRVAGGLCKIVSFVPEPGVIRHAGVAPRIEFGELDGPPRARTRALLAAFEGAQGVTAVLHDDIQVPLWDKFLFIAPFSGVGALARATAGEMRAQPETRELLRAAMAEVHALAMARGVALRPDAVERTLSFLDALPAEATASMQRDLMEGRPSELEYQNGAVVRLGRAAGVPVPVHTFILASLLPAERRARATLA